MDWAFATDVAEIELQLADESTSRTVWVLVNERNAYIPASLDFPPLKSWHKRAREDGRAIVRVEGKRYERTLDIVTDEALRDQLSQIASAKYELGEGAFDPTRVWLFRLDPR